MNNIFDKLSSSNGATYFVLWVRADKKVGPTRRTDRTSVRVWAHFRPNFEPDLVDSGRRARTPSLGPPVGGSLVVLHPYRQLAIASPPPRHHRRRPILVPRPPAPPPVPPQMPTPTHAAGHIVAGPPQLPRPQSNVAGQLRRQHASTFAGVCKACRQLCRQRASTFAGVCKACRRQQPGDQC